eukprot:10822848-Karenia_brevis.AAC.1
MRPAWVVTSGPEWGMRAFLGRISWICVGYAASLGCDIRCWVGYEGRYRSNIVDLGRIFGQPGL